MKHEFFLFALTLLLGLATGCKAQAGSSTEALAHTRVEFHFVAEAPFEQVAPLFGANEERKWSPDWNPQFPLSVACAR
jgi:hypothetical protein